MLLGNIKSVTSILVDLVVIARRLVDETGAAGLRIIVIARRLVEETGTCTALGAELCIQMQDHQQQSTISSTIPEKRRASWVDKYFILTCFSRAC
jgi:hypothetical protein